MTSAKIAIVLTATLATASAYGRGARPSAPVATKPSVSTQGQATSTPTNRLPPMPATSKGGTIGSKTGTPAIDMGETAKALTAASNSSTAPSKDKTFGAAFNRLGMSSVSVYREIYNAVSDLAGVEDPTAQYTNLQAAASETPSWSTDSLEGQENYLEYIRRTARNDGPLYSRLDSARDMGDKVLDQEELRTLCGIDTRSPAELALGN